MTLQRIRVALLGAACALLLSGTAQAQVSFYEDIYYGGASFSAGSDLSFVGWDWNDRISSMSIPAGMSVTVYQDIDFGGASLTLTGDIVDLRWDAGPGPDGTWNDQVSSIRISGGSWSPTTTTILLNGSFNQSPPWTQPGSPEFNAVAATYGQTPVVWQWTNDINNFAGVTFPNYDGIVAGAYGLAAFIDGLPGGDINVVAHSHGGNVLGLATWVAHRPLKHVINLATPVNYDLQPARWMAPPPLAPYSRCQASSFVDWVQFLGSSPFQVTEFIYASYDAEQLVNMAIDAAQQGDWAGALEASALAAAYAGDAFGWWMSTKVEWAGPTYMWWDGHQHGDMHEPDVWNAIAGACAVN